MSHAESVFMKSAAMGVLPFTMSADLIEKMQNLKDTEEYDFIELSIIDEEIRYVSDHLTSGLDLYRYVDVIEAR